MWPRDGILTGRTSPRKSEPGSNGNEEVIYTLQISRTGASSSNATECHIQDTTFLVWFNSVLWHINHCRLFIAKSIFIHMNSSVSNNFIQFFVYTHWNVKTVLFQTIQFSLSMQFKCQKQVCFKHFSSAKKKKKERCWRNRKNRKIRMFTLRLCITLCMCVCVYVDVCVRMCIDYICVLLCVVVYVIVSM